MKRLILLGSVLSAIIFIGSSQAWSDSVDSTLGRWEGPYPWPVFAMHAALLPTGQVLHYAPAESGPGSEASLWDPTNPSIMEAVSPNKDLFCSGHSFLPDGRLLVTGGTDPRSRDPKFFGIRDTHIFDPFTRTWTRVQDMAVGRWYPTNITLSDGRVLVFSGLDSHSRTTDLVEIFHLASGWRVISGAEKELELYPRMHLLPSGKIFHAGPEQETQMFDPVTLRWGPTIYRSNYGTREEGTSVLLPLMAPAYRPKVLILGGDDPATNTAEIIDFEVANPSWRSIASMNHAREHANAVSLPDGRVLVVGGGRTGESEDPVYAAELFNPEQETWTEMASMKESRMYHSTALLLPDGRVLVSGGEGHGDNYTAEIYSPPYLFRGPRPQVSSAPDSLTYGSNLQVSTPDATQIAKVVLIRLSAVTHSVNMEQRSVGLDFQKSGNSLMAQVPNNPNVAPPGYYMLFLVNTVGVPSVARLVRIEALTGGPSAHLEASIQARDVNGGILKPRDLIEYTITLGNTGTAPQLNNSGNELEDSIPPEGNFLRGSLVASVGQAKFNASQKRVEWNGSLAPGDSATIRFRVRLKARLLNDAAICTQGKIFFDSDGDGINESSALSDDSSTSSAMDPTCVHVGATIPASVQAITVKTSSGDHKITFELLGHKAQEIQLEVFTLAGKLVFYRKSVGNHLEWPLASQPANGVYLYRVAITEIDKQTVQSEVRKLVILR